MIFGNRNLQRLMQIPRTEPEESAKQANLCMENRISASRQADYEAAVGSPGDWGAWQDGHARYVQMEIRRRHPLSAAFGSGEPSIRSDIEPNQYLYRVERIDELLRKYERRRGCEFRRRWPETVGGGDRLRCRRARCAEPGAGGIEPDETGGV